MKFNSYRKPRILLFGSNYKEDSEEINSNTNYVFEVRVDYGASLSYDFITRA